MSALRRPMTGGPSPTRPSEEELAQMCAAFIAQAKEELLLVREQIVRLREREKMLGELVDFYANGGRFERVP